MLNADVIKSAQILGMLALAQRLNGIERAFWEVIGLSSPAAAFDLSDDSAGGWVVGLSSCFDG
jgi:hypothetical protein